MKLHLTILLGLCLAGCNSTNANHPVTFTPVPDSNLQQVSDSQFARYVVTDPTALSRYSKVIFYPTQFDRLKIDERAPTDAKYSWLESTWDEMDSICQFFDELALKTFSERQGFTPTNKGGKDVLAVELRLMNFMPYGKRYVDHGLGTVGVSSSKSGVGLLTFQAVIADSQTGELIAVIEDGMEINAGNMMMIKGDLDLQLDSNNKVAQNIGWRKTFKRWAVTLHEEMTRLQANPLLVSN